MELESLAIANHYKTLIFGSIRASGISHAMALRYCEIDRIKARINNNFVGLFNKLWEEHPAKGPCGEWKLMLQWMWLQKETYQG